MSTCTSTVTLRDGRTCVTEFALANISSITDFVASISEASPDAEFELRAMYGPAFVGRYGDIVSVHIEIPR